MGKIIKGKYIEFDGRTSSSLNNVKIHFGIQQEGSGQPAVDNVRPLSGYGTIMLNISGKNLLNENLVVHNTWVRAGTDGSYGGRSSNSYDAAFLDVASFQGKTLTISQGPEASSDGSGLPYYGISFLDKTNTIQSYYRNTAGKGKPMTFVVPEGTARIGYTYPIEDRTTAQVELGDKVTSFDTRKAQRYPIIFKANDTDLAHQSNCQILENIAITDAGQLSASTRSLTMVLPCKPNTIYSIEHLINNIRVDYERFAIGCNSTLQTAANTQINILSTLPKSCGYKYLTIKTLPDANYLYLRYRGGGTNVNENTPEDCLAGLHVYECKELCNGVVDVNVGTVTVDWEYITFDGSSDEAWNVETGSAGTNFYIQIPDAAVDNARGEQILCNVAKNKATGGWAPGCCFISSTKNLNLAIGDLIGVTSVANFKTWLTTNNVQVVYELATPKTYQIEPYTLELLSEKNILWTDSEVQVEATIEDETFTTVNSGNTIDSTDIASFVTSSCFPIESLKVYFTPKQAGSGDPSPTNTRAISGYTNIKAEQRGRNLLINIAPPGNSIVTLNSDGSMTFNGTFSGASWFHWNTSVNFTATSTTQYVQTRLLPNGKYYGGPDFYVDENHATNGYPRFSPDLSNYDGTNTRTGTMPTIDSDGCFVIDDTYKYNWYRIYQTAANTFSNYTIYPRCFLASETDRSWEPCTFNTYTINLGDTYYGGYVDLISGTLVVDTGYVSDLGALSWSLNSGERYRYYCRDLQATAAPSSLRSTWCLCSNLIPITDGRAYADCPDRCIYFTDTKSINVHFLDIDSDAAAVKAALSGVSFAYKLATPQVIHLTPQKIRTLLGRNNIWSFDGTVEVKYSDIQDSPEIMQKRRFFMANSPHLQQAESGNTGYCDAIARFKTNLTLPLKEATVTLSPIQAGSGDPSPTNVRAISGVDSIQVTKAGVNLLECDTFTDGTQGGITYTGTRNSDGQITSITASGSSSSTNSFRNLNYTPSVFKLLNGQFAFYGYSSQIGINAVWSSDSYVDINGNKSSAYTSASWREFNIVKMSNSVATWARMQVFPSVTNTAVNTTVYPMMCLPQDEGCDYEPFKGIKYSISLPTTIYEGTLNLITGELTVNYKLYTFTGEETGLIYNWDGMALKISDSINSNSVYGIKACSHAHRLMAGGDVFNTSRTQAPNDTSLPVCASCSSGSQLRFRNRDVDPNFTQDIELYRTWLRQQYAAGTPLQMVYKLQTPLVYQLTPPVIRTFRGVNNIWADNGIMNIKYWAI